MIQLNDLLLLKYPNADFTSDIKLADYMDGKGIVIVEWNLNTPRPTTAQINAWLADVEVPQRIQHNKNKILNQRIYKELADIDLKSIRSLRVNDTAKLALLEEQAVALRLQLLPVSK